MPCLGDIDRVSSEPAVRAPTAVVVSFQRYLRLLDELNTLRRNNS